jgi:hypothetical protein
MTPNEAEQALYQDLLSIYARAGAEVTYETDRGDIRPYWAKRFLQAVKRSQKNDELFDFVVRLLQPDEPSRGFLILKKAGRLDLTVEALVIDARKPYHPDFAPEIVDIARARLQQHGYEEAAAGSFALAAEPGERPTFRLEPGATFDLRVSVADDGAVSLTVI